MIRFTKGMRNNASVARRFTSLVILVLTIILLGQAPMTACALERTISISSSVYEFDGDSDYEYSDASANVGATSLSSLSIFGSVTEAETRNGVTSYTVSNGELSFKFSFDQAILRAAEDEWHLVDDKTKTVGNLTLDSNILSGALILRSSLDGKAWANEVIQNDIFSGDVDFSNAIYTTKYLQQQNGCYFQLIVAYKMEIKTGSHNVLFFPKDDMSYKKIAEVYEFYIYDPVSSGTTNTSLATPRKELGSKINTGHDNGYSGEVAIDKDDPHFGWDLGTFIINGYTRETKDGDTPVFLKNAGDKVTLWFHLSQNIDSLCKEDSGLSISEDTNGYDRDFEISQTNFGRGTLIIRYTNEQGVSEEPVVYTNYLAANTKTGADTNVILFEEGDYEVSLNYEIKKEGLFPSYNDYKISFRFSVRNGNCMVFPFDVVTESELSDHAITANGFMLDMAKSRYLTIDVKKSMPTVGADGQLYEDVRFNRPAKDGDSYTNEGIYTFTVKNLYTGESTTKTIYVGDNKYLNALSASGLTMTELSAQIAQGAEVLNDGTISWPESVESEPEPESDIAEETVETDEGASGAEDDSIEPIPPNFDEPAAESADETPESMNFKPLVICVIAMVFIASLIVFVKRKKHKEQSLLKMEENGR